MKSDEHNFENVMIYHPLVKRTISAVHTHINSCHINTATPEMVDRKPLSNISNTAGITAPPKRTDATKTPSKKTVPVENVTKHPTTVNDVNQ